MKNNNTFNSTISTSCNSNLKLNETLNFQLTNQTNLPNSLLNSRLKNIDNTEISKVRIIRAHNNCVAIAYKNYFCCFW